MRRAHLEIPDHPARKGGDHFAAKGTPARLPVAAPPRRRFPATTHLGGGPSRTLRPRAARARV